MTALPTTSRQLRSLVRADGTLELSLVDVDIPQPGENEVVVRIDASPINPSDLGLLLAMADLSTLATNGDALRPVVTAMVPPNVLRGLAARLGESMAVGNEGGGIVVVAGSSPAAQALVGSTVGALGGSMYSQFRCVNVNQCLALPAGTTAEQAASCFVNPLTSLSMVENMRRDGFTALVHTAAASNLGQMLNRICIADGVPLVNIVRKTEQAELLRSQGATYVVDSSEPTFADDLTQAIIATGAMLAFDATGGGTLASQILASMEAAATATASEYSRYGSSVHKQVYIYGGLDRGPTTLSRTFGMSWGVGGWLLTPFLGLLGRDGTQRLKDRVAAEITTTFASRYTTAVSLTGALRLDAIRQYAKQATGEKYIVTPNA